MAENQTCFPEVEFNEVLQDKIIKSVFDKLSTCTDEQTLKNNINSILQEKSQQGLISLEPLRESNDVQAQINLLIECSLSETSKLIDENIEIDAAYVISGIVKFICNPPSFDFPSLDLSFKFSLKDFFIKLLFQFIDLLTQILLQIIQQIINIVLNICETNFESLLQGYENIVNILSNSFQEAINFKINDIISSLQPLFRTFGFNSDGTLIESPNFISCESNIGSIRPVNQFLNDLSMMVTPFEICSLFEGVPSQQTLELVRELLQFEYPLLQTRLSDDVIVTNFFVSIGRFIPSSICRKIRETYTDEYAYSCGEEYSQREQAKLSILNRNGHTEEQSREAIRRERERYSNRLKDLGSFVAKLRGDPEKVFDSVSNNIFCKGGKAGMASLSDIPSAVVTTTIVVNGFYNPLKSAHYNDSLNIQDLYFKKQTQRKKVARFASPERPVTIGGIRYIGGETVKFKQVQALGNPIYYTNKEEFALMVEEYQPDERITYQSTIEKKIYDYVKGHFDDIGRMISLGESSDEYEYYFGDSGGNTYSVSQITQVYNPIVNNLDEIARRIYNDKVKYYSDANIYERAANNITKDELVGYITESIGNSTDDAENICEKFVKAGFIYTEEKIFVPSPSDIQVNLLDSYSTDINFSLDRNIENTLEEFFDGLKIVVPSFSSDSFTVGIDDYTVTVTRTVETPPLKNIYTLRQLNVEDDGFIDDRWLADINKINAANESEKQPLGILEEVQLSNLNEYQGMNLEFDSNNNSFSNTQLKFQSIQNIIDPNKPQDNSIITINKVYRKPTTSLSDTQREQYNSFLTKEYGISNLFTTNNTLLYDNSDITTGPFRQPTDSIIQQLKQIVPNPVSNESLQIQAFKAITGFSSTAYYSIFSSFVQDVSLNTKITQANPEYKKIKDTILIIPFERIIGINKVKNTTLTAFLSDPCAISQDIQKQDEISLFNSYLVESTIKLLVRTFCLKNDLKDLLSLVNINPYTFVNNDDTYIEFLLQTFKQDLKRLSGGDYFYNQVILYIEKSVDKILELEGVLIDPISGQQISLDQELTTDFKIRFFIKKEYADMLVRLENIFVSNNTQRQTNFDNIKRIMRNRAETAGIIIPAEFDNLFFEYIFPVSKICSIVKINNIISMTTNYDNSNDTYSTTLQTLKSMILNFLNDNSVDCNSNLPSFNLELPEIDLELIKQFLIRAPIEIIKGIAETFDPNIRIANPIRRLTELFTGNNLPCLPFSLALLPIGTVPFGIGPPILPPWGFAYLTIDTAEYLLTPAEKNKRLKFALGLGIFDKLEDLFEKDENC
jgi:hypothetical protein